MKDIRQIRENYNLITEKEEADVRKLTSLVRAGLFDAKKLPILKRAMEKESTKMTPAERKVLFELLDSLMGEVLGSQQVYSKVKQSVSHKDKLDEAKQDYLSKYDPRFGVTDAKQKDLPNIIILKRKAIRVYPDNQKVGLYYSQALDKYVSIPFGGRNDTSVISPLNEAAKDEEDLRTVTTKYKTTSPENRQEYLKRQKTIASIRNRLASGSYKNPQQMEKQLKARQQAADKLKDVDVTKKMDLYKQTARTLSQPHYERLQKAIKSDDSIDFGTSLAISQGLKAARRTNPISRTITKGLERVFKDKTDTGITTTRTPSKPEKPSTTVTEAFRQKLFERKVYERDDSALNAAHHSFIQSLVGGAERNPDDVGDVANAQRASAERQHRRRARGDVQAATDSNRQELERLKSERDRAQAANPGVTTAANIAGAVTGLAAGGGVLAAGRIASAGVRGGATGVVRDAAKNRGGFRRKLRRGADAAGAVGSILAGAAGGKGGGDEKLPRAQSAEFTKTAGGKISDVATTSSDATRKERERQQYLKSLKESNEVLNTLKKVRKESIKESNLNINGKNIIINNTIAEKILYVYENLNLANKVKMREMLSESVDSFKKVVNFVARQ